MGSKCVWMDFQSFESQVEWIQYQGLITFENQSKAAGGRSLYAIYMRLRIAVCSRWGQQTFGPAPSISACVCVCLGAWLCACGRSGSCVGECEKWTIFQQSSSQKPLLKSADTSTFYAFLCIDPRQTEDRPSQSSTPMPHQTKPNQPNYPPPFPKEHKHSHTHTLWSPSHAHLFVCIVQWQPSLIWFSYAEWNLRVEWMRRIQRPAVVGEHLYRGGFMNFVVFIIFYDSIY